jgi:hypothetical protein
LGRSHPPQLRSCRAGRLARRLRRVRLCRRAQPDPTPPRQAPSRSPRRPPGRRPDAPHQILPTPTPRRAGKRRRSREGSCAKSELGARVRAGAQARAERNGGRCRQRPPSARNSSASPCGRPALAQAGRLSFGKQLPSVCLLRSAFALGLPLCREASGSAPASLYADARSRQLPTPPMLRRLRACRAAASHRLVASRHPARFGPVPFGHGAESLTRSDSRKAESACG